MSHKKNGTVGQVEEKKVETTVNKPSENNPASKKQNSNDNLVIALGLAIVTIIIMLIVLVATHSKVAGTTTDSVTLNSAAVNPQAKKSAAKVAAFNW